MLQQEIIVLKKISCLGQTIPLAHLAPFVEVSRQALIKEVREEIGSVMSDAVVFDIAERRLKKEIRRGVQTIQYQVITLNTTNGQAPFLTINMYLNEVNGDQRLKDDLAMIIEEMLKQRIQGVKNADGIWITPAFPKLVYVLEEDNIHPESKYYYLTELAAKCTAKRMVPDYVSEKIMLQLKKDVNGEGHCYPPMGCRSFLTPDLVNGVAKFYGRFNQGVCTLSLTDVALSSNGDYDKFWSIFEERLELCHRALMIRHEHLLGTTSDVAPILWQHGAIARLKPGETIDHLLYNGYSTISLGYAGLYECVKYMTGKSHTS
jgi:ribonucleoside-triphosphate reductase